MTKNSMQKVVALPNQFNYEVLENQSRQISKVSSKG